MDKFCGECGAKLDEKTGLCTNCGTDSANDKCEKKEKRTAMSIEGKIRKKFLKLIIMLFLLGLLIAGTSGILIYFDIVEIPIASQMMESVGILKNRNDRELINLAGKFTNIQVVDEASAIKAAQETALSAGLKNAADELTLSRMDAVGEFMYYRLQQNYKNIPIYGKTITITADKSGKACAFISNVVDISKEISLETSVSANEVEKAINNYIQKLSEDITIASISEMNEESLVIYSKDDVHFKLAYILKIYTTGVENFEIVIDADTAKVLACTSNLNTVVTTGYSASDHNNRFDVSLENNEYKLYDENRKIVIWTLDGNNSETNVGSSLPIKSVNNIFGDTEEEVNLKYDTAIDLYHNVIGIYDYYDQKIHITYPYPYLIVCYDDMCDKGRNANGGSIDIKSEGIENGFISMGRERGVHCIDVIAHEYTHMISKKIVGWNSNYSIRDENAAVNEALSDIMGIIIENAIEGKTDWCIAKRNIANPHATGNPNSYLDKWYKYVVTDEHFSSTIISHAAYLMNAGVDGSYAKLSMDELARLWIYSMYSFPSDCNFSECRECVEVTASVLNFSEEKRQCISAAFDKVGIKKQSKESDNYSTNSQVTVYDSNLDEYSDYTVVVNGTKNVALWGAINTKFYQKFKPEKSSSIVNLELPEGTYDITVIDNQNLENTYYKKIKTKKKGKNTSLSFVTNFVTKSENGKELEEGYYTNPTYIEASVLKDKEEVTFLSLFINEYNDIKNLFLRFVWRNGEFQQIESSDGRQYKVSCSLNEDGIRLMFKKVGEKYDTVYDMKKEKWFNVTNTILAVKNYFKEKRYYNLDDTIEYAFPTDGLTGGWLSEAFCIPVYRENTEEEVYYVVVANEQFEEAGEASIYKAEDLVDARMIGDALEEFNVYDYFDFYKEKENNDRMSEEEIYTKLVEHYKKGTEDESGEGMTVMEGSFDDDIYYSTSVRCGVPGNFAASQRLYEVVVNAETGVVEQTRVLTDNKVVRFNLND